VRRLALLALLAVAACRSSKPDAPKRDYRSINRTSVAFVKETYRKGKAMRKENLATITDWGAQKERRKAERKWCRTYAAETTFGSVFSESLITWRDVKRETDFNRESFRRSVRFGFLDSGE
jgi:hypothetical protein